MVPGYDQLVGVVESLRRVIGLSFDVVDSLTIIISCDDASLSFQPSIITFTPLSSSQSFTVSSQQRTIDTYGVSIQYAMSGPDAYRFRAPVNGVVDLLSPGTYLRIETFLPWN
jgi:hypothetical protein